MNDDARCALRFAVGVGLAVALAYGVNWSMSWLATLLTAAFLGNRAPRPGPRAALAIVLAIATIFGAGLFVTVFLYPYPAVFTFVFCLGIYTTFYLGARGTSKFIVLLCTMAILVIPVVGGPTPALALLVAQGFLVSAIAALLCTLVAHTLVPGGTQAPIAAEAAVDPHPLRTAWLSSAVILPVAVVSLAMNATGAVLPLIMIATLSAKPDFSVGAAGGKALIVANLGGGLVAVVFYQLLLVSPTYAFLVSGFVALALLFGQRIFSDQPTGPLYASAFSTVLILIGGGTGQFGGDTEAGFEQRMLLIMAAVCYVVGALSLLQMPSLQARWMRAGRWLGAKLAGT